ncbi:MAG: isoprenyl transferase [Acidobacteria bacterium]|nr:isoprenyl transferase [Acidobacteriota bacterium]
MAMRIFNKSISDEEYLYQQLDPAKLPTHVAIIMDGNGRWAGKRKLPRVAGHREGAESVRTIVETAARLGIQHLTLFAFSTENWKRPKIEVRALMDLLMEFIRQEIATLKKNNIRFQMLGRSEGLHISVLEQIRKAELSTFQNTGLQLNIAINYSGRAEILDACRELAREVAEGRLQAADINDEVIANKLYTRAMPDPDLLIRTSGEMRVSNFLLWQIAYAEIYVTEKLWPDFRTAEFYQALLAYQKRDRRFGGISLLQDATAPR